jgi:hypothetical protein
MLLTQEQAKYTMLGDEGFSKIDIEHVPLDILESFKGLDDFYYEYEHEHKFDNWEEIDAAIRASSI